MAQCNICGASCGMFNGGEEPFTGESLYVCSECGTVLKSVNTAQKKGDVDECRKLLQTLINKSKDSDVTAALTGYFQKILGQSVNAEQLKQKEEERARQKETLRQNAATQYSKNAYYEYCVETILDTSTGSFNKEQVQNVLTNYSLDGWRLHTAFSNELGKNAIAALGFGVNGTVEETILIFERCIKEKEH